MAFYFEFNTIISIHFISIINGYVFSENNDIRFPIQNNIIKKLWDYNI